LPKGWFVVNINDQLLGGQQRQQKEKASQLRLAQAQLHRERLEQKKLLTSLATTERRVSQLEELPDILKDLPNTPSIEDMPNPLENCRDKGGNPLRADM
jgi:hypothetical protein